MGGGYEWSLQEEEEWAGGLPAGPPVMIFESCCSRVCGGATLSSILITVPEKPTEADAIVILTMPSRREEAEGWIRSFSHLCAFADSAWSEHPRCFSLCRLVSGPSHRAG